MNTASQNRLKKVQPELARRVTLLIQALADKGYTVEVVQGLRHSQSRMSSTNRAGQSRVRWLPGPRVASQVTITVWQSTCVLL
jgi:hypothetical protein